MSHFISRRRYWFAAWGRFRFLTVTGLILTIGTILTGPAGIQAEIQGPEIKIGAISASEGPWGSPGKRNFAGMRIGAEQLNALGGIEGVPVRLVEYDTHGRLEEVAPIMRRLITVDKVLATVGPFLSGEGEVAFPIANKFKVPTLAPATAKGGLMAKNRPWAFRIVMPDDANTGPVIDEVVKEKNIKSVAIIMDVKDAISKYMGTYFWPALFKRLGVKNLTEKDQVTFQGGDPSVTAQVTKVKAMNPDAVVLACSPGDAGKVAVEVRRQGMTQQLIGAGGIFSGGQQFIKAGGESVEGAITAAQFWRENPDPEVQNLVREMEAEIGEPIALHHAHGRDAVFIVAEAIKRAGITNRPEDLEKDRARIQQVLDEGLKIKGVTGTFALEPKTGEVLRPLMRATVVNGEWQIKVIKTVE